MRRGTEEGRDIWPSGIHTEDTSSLLHLLDHVDDFSSCRHNHQGVQGSGPSALQDMLPLHLATVGKVPVPHWEARELCRVALGVFAWLRSVATFTWLLLSHEEQRDFGSPCKARARCQISAFNFSKLYPHKNEDFKIITLLVPVTCNYNKLQTCL